MKDQIIMSNENGNCAVAVPLFRFNIAEEIESMKGYSIMLTKQKPIAFAVDFGDQIAFMDANFLKDKVEWLGDL